MKIAVNRCSGGFSVSKAVYDEIGIEWVTCEYLGNDYFGIESDNREEYRKHPKLIAAIEKIGEKKSSSSCANIEIVDIPEDVEWEIDEDNGMESIHEIHRIW